MASGWCDFCQCWHSASCCHPGRVAYDVLKAENALLSSRVAIREAEIEAAHREFNEWFSDQHEVDGLSLAARVAVAHGHASQLETSITALEKTNVELKAFNGEMYDDNLEFVKQGDALASKNKELKELNKATRWHLDEALLENETLYRRVSELEAERDKLQARDEKYSDIPCAECGGKCVEFSVPNDIWNMVMRPNGEHDKEYICIDCWYKFLRKYIISIAESQSQHAEFGTKLAQIAILETESKGLQAEIDEAHDVLDKLGIVRRWLGVPERIRYLNDILEATRQRKNIDDTNYADLSIMLTWLDRDTARRWSALWKQAAKGYKEETKHLKYEYSAELDFAIGERNVARRLVRDMFSTGAWIKKKGLYHQVRSIIEGWDSEDD